VAYRSLKGRRKPAYKLHSTALYPAQELSKLAQTIFFDASRVTCRDAFAKLIFYSFGKSSLIFTMTKSQSDQCPMANQVVLHTTRPSEGLNHLDGSSHKTALILGRSFSLSKHC